MIRGREITGIWIDELSTFDKMMGMTTFSENDSSDIIDLKAKIRQGILGKLSDPLYDDSFVKFIKENCVVSGGCSASWYYNQEPNDYDLYFKSAEALDQFNRYMDKTRQRNLVKDVNPNYMSTIVAGKLITSQATTLFNDVQIITMGTIDMIDDFDFIHCKPYLDLSADKYYISKKQFDAIKTKRLIINKTAKQEVKPYRIDKYESRGWKR